ncbi:methyltransferase domain-containing protein [Desulfovibrio sp. X2]|uniref:methyltransferase domain-containing protein n=1 Tax=Desulfovibrio sp. X2 TaxID=941449 RepID=UPI000552A7CA|nr:methyltransferase domain-containing protein [Desulfovibrio sp. X2]
MQHSRQELLKEAEQRLASLGQERIWRPVFAPDGRQLAEGTGADDDGLPPDLAGLDFTGKNVVDIGCNLGHFSFLAAEHGAASVLGIDMDEEVVACARVLARLRGADNVSFLAADVLGASAPAPDGRTFDTSMMIDIIGRGSVRKGLAGSFLDAAARLASHEMIHTMRPIYSFKELGVSGADLARFYPERFLREERFDLLAFALDRFAVKWSAELLTREADLTQRYKYLVRFTRI